MFGLGTMKGFPKHAPAARMISSQVEDLVLLASGEGMVGLFFAHRIGENEVPEDDRGNVDLNAAEEQLGEFFAGTRESFEVAFDGGARGQK